MVHALNSLKSSSKSTKNMMSYSSQPIDETIPRFTIMYALKKGYLNLIRHLLCTGVNPNQTDSKDKHSRTPLIYCAYIKDTNWALSIAQNLLECGANIKQCDNRGLNVLHYCCTFNKYKLLELFLNSLDFDLLNEVDINGNTCLHYATAFRNLKCIRLVLSKCKQYNLTNIERENAFEFKPSDMLNLNHIHFSKEIDEKCKLILVNYERNLLPNRKSFDNLANIMPLNNDKKHRPITAPLSTNEEIDSDDERKQKITFSESEAHRNQKKRSFSTQSQNIMKLKIQNENILPANQNKEISSHFLNSNSLFSKNEYFSKSKMKAFQLSKSSFEADDYSNQLVIKMKDYLSKTIIFSELCVDKEYIVNPKGINSMMIVNNYHFHQSSNLNPSKSTLKNACTKDQLNEEQNEGRVLSSKTQKSIQSSIEGDKRISQNNLITSKPPLSYIKPHCLTSMTGISGRQSRQSFFTGCLVSSQSDVLDQMNFESVEDIFSANQTPRGMKDKDENQQIQKQIEKSYEVLTGWKKYYMKNILNNLELKTSPSFRKHINVPVNTVAPGPVIDVSSSTEFNDFSKAKLNYKNKKASKNPQSRLNSATSVHNNLNISLSTKKK